MVTRILEAALAFCALVCCARADCEACVNGQCHYRKTLIQGFHVSDHFAIDQTNNILYAQINSNLNTAFYLDDLKIHLVQTSNTNAMAFDQDKEDLYTANNDNKRVYKYNKAGKNIIEDISSVTQYPIDVMFYRNYLYYTPKMEMGLHIIYNGTEKVFIHLTSYKITDFVVTKNDYVYFVANDSLYEYKNSWLHAPKCIANKTYVLSTDKNGDVYFGDASINVIYTINESKELVEFAAYKTGSVDRFVFDNSNNIVFHDALDGNIVSWKMDSKKCNIYAPHDKYSIKEVTGEPCNNSVPEIEEQK